MNNNIPESIQEPIKEQVQNEQQPTTQQIQPEQVEDKNWAAIREQRKADRKAREEADKRAADKAAEAEALRAALEAITNKPSPQYRQEEREETEDEVLNRRVDAIIKQREAEYMRKNEEREKAEFPTRLRQALPDFDKVCDAENLDYLEYHHPELIEPFKHMPEGYKKWEALYKVTKKLVPNLDRKDDQKRMEKNLMKPGSISSTGTTQGVGIAPPARLTEEKRMENWRRMQRDIKGLK